MEKMTENMDELVAKIKSLEQTVQDLLIGGRPQREKIEHMSAEVRDDNPYR